MEIKIAEITVEHAGRGDRYFVMYPSRGPVESPASWMVLDAGGGPVCIDGYVDDIRGALPDEFIDALVAAASAAVEKSAGEPLEERLGILGITALEWAEDFGWLARYGRDDGEVILPNTRVWFPAGIPAELPAALPLRRALRLLADCVRAEVAEPLSPWTIVRPANGAVLTAAELAAAD